VDFLAGASALKDALLGRGLRGASTLTMQLAAALDDDLQPAQGRRGMLQKIAQMRAAWAIERAHDKREILEAYLNTVTFRGELQGIAAASWALFGKAPQGLDARESALLAAMLRAPHAGAAALAARACGLLAARQSPCDGVAVLAQLVTMRRGQPMPGEQLAPHLARQLLASPGERVRSTIDAGVQRQVMQALGEQLRELAGRNVEDGAAVVLDNASGEVLAYVGSSGGLSRAAFVDGASALRQAGSTLKPFLYALAFDRRLLTAASLLDDSPLAIRTADAQYLPRNYDRDFRGWVSARKALAGSLNVPAVRVLAMMEFDGYADALRAAGLASVTQSGDWYGASLALGSADVRLIELANAYRTLANGGVYSPLRMSFEGESIDSAVSKDAARPAFSAGAAAIVADILADNEARSITFGLDSPLRLPFWAAVKTGTSKDMRDNWCIGFSRRYTVGVWVGNASGAPMHDVSGIHGAAPVWHDVMRALHRGVPSLPPPLPAGVVRQPLRFAGVAEPARSELFLRGTEQALVALAERSEAAARALPPQITAPLDGAIYALDPDLPLERQQLLLERDGAPARWAVDGRPLGAARRQPWGLQPGRHVIALLDAQGRERDRVAIEVRLPPLARLAAGVQ
jgi:penicillin-binding protein 1C